MGFYLLLLFVPLIVYIVYMLYRSVYKDFFDDWYVAKSFSGELAVFSPRIRVSKNKSMYVSGNCEVFISIMGPKICDSVKSTVIEVDNVAVNFKRQCKNIKGGLLVTLTPSQKNSVYIRRQLFMKHEIKIGKTIIPTRGYIAALQDLGVANEL